MKKISFTIILILNSLLLQAAEPVFSPKNPIDSLWEDSLFSETYIAADPESDSLFFTVLQKPDSVKDSLLNDTTLLLLWAPTQDDTGTYQISIQVRDLENLYDTINQDWIVFPVNDPPVFRINTFHDTLSENTVYTKEIIYYDPDDTTFQFEIIHKPGQMTIDTFFNDSTVLIQWSPGDNETGQDSLTLVIQDTSSQSDTLNGYFYVLNLNDAPEFEMDTLRKNLPEGQNYQQEIRYTDVDGDTSFMFQVLYQPVGFMIDSLYSDSSIQISWTPDSGDIGTDSFAVVIYDDSSATDTLWGIFTVLNLNSPPEFEIDTLKTTIQENQLYEKEVFYRDPDHDTNFIFQTLYKPEDMILNTVYSDSSVLISYQPGNEDVGIDSMALVIQDDSLATDTLLGIFTIIDINQPPEATEIIFPSNESVYRESNLLVKLLPGLDEDLNDTLSYQVYYSKGLTGFSAIDSLAVWEKSNQDTISIQFSNQLEEDTWYRATAFVKDRAGEYDSYDTVSFFVNTFNMLPEFEKKSPLDSSVVFTKLPQLLLSNFHDTDDSIFYSSFRIYDSAETIIDSSYLSTDSFFIPQDSLQENKKYYWNAQVQDQTGDTTAWTEKSIFFVNSLFEPPNTPINYWIDQLDSASMILRVQRPAFIWEITDPPDPDPLITNDSVAFVIQIFQDTTATNPDYSFQTDQGVNYYYNLEYSLQDNQYYYTRIYAIDNNGLQSAPSNFLKFKVEVSNDPPIVISIPDTNAYEDIPYNYILKVFDEENDQIYFDFIQNPQGMMIDSSRKIADTTYAYLNWTPAETQIGNHTIKIQVRDEKNSVYDHEFSITVHNTNDPPLIISPPKDTNIVVREPNTMSVNLTAIDSDPFDSVRFGFRDSLPGWLNIELLETKQDTFQVKLFGNPQASDAGIRTIIYYAIDDSNSTDTNQFAIQVKKRNFPPEKPSLVSPFNNEIITDTNAPTLICNRPKDEDPEDSVLNYQFEISREQNFSNIFITSPLISSSAKTISWLINTKLDDFENDTFYWRVSAFDSFDSQSEYSDTFQFSLNLINDPPSLPQMIYPDDLKIIKNSDSIFFRISNPVDPDPDTPIDSLTGNLHVMLGGDIIFDTLFRFDETSANTSIYLLNSFSEYENQRFAWKIGISDNFNGYQWQDTFSFYISLIDEPPGTINSFIVKKDRESSVPGQELLEVDEPSVYFEWEAPNTEDPDDYADSLKYKIFILNRTTVVDTLITNQGVLGVNSINDNGLKPNNEFELIDNQLYSAAISAIDQSNLASEFYYSPYYFIYNQENDLPYQPQILNIFGDNLQNEETGIVPDTFVTVYFSTPGDYDYTDSIDILKYSFQVSRDSNFESIEKYQNDVEYNSLDSIRLYDNMYYILYQFPYSLENHQTFYIRMRVSDDTPGVSRYSDPVKFITQAGNRPPDSTRILVLSDSAEINDTTNYHFYCEKSSDKDGDEVFYRFLLYELRDTAFIYIDSSNFIQDTVWRTLNRFNENSIYKLYINVFDGELFSKTDSVLFAVNLKNDPPTIPQSFRMRDRNEETQVLSVKKPYFQWNRSNDDDPFENELLIQYMISLFSTSDTNEVSPEITYFVGKGKENYDSKNDPELVEDRTYYARIKAFIEEPYQESKWSEYIFFNVNTENEPPTIHFTGLLADSNQTFKQSPLLLKWISKDNDGDSLRFQIKYLNIRDNIDYTLFESAQGEVATENDTLFQWYWDWADFLYVDFGQNNSQLQVIVNDKIATDTAVSENFTIAPEKGPQPRVFSPGNEITRINFHLNQPTHVTIKIYNLAQRLVKKLVDNQFFSESENFVEWNGRDSNGSILPNRVYFIVIEKQNQGIENYSVILMRK